MKRLLLTPAALVILACQAAPPTDPSQGLEPALAVGADAHSPTVKTLPYQAGGSWWTTAVDYAECAGPNTYSTSSRIRGEATHLGRFEGAWSTCWGSDGSLVFQAGDLTGANGDILSIFGSAASGTIFVVNPDLTWETRGGFFNGGTGRFAGTTGRFDCAGSADATLSMGEMTCHGWLSSVGPNR